MEIKLQIINIKSDNTYNWKACVIKFKYKYIAIFFSIAMQGNTKPYECHTRFLKRGIRQEKK